MHGLIALISTHLETNNIT